MEKQKDIYDDVPDELFEGIDEKTIEVSREVAARIGRYAILNEMGFFGEQTNLKLARGEYKGKFEAAVRKRFSGLYGDSAGCHAADLEVAAEMLGVFDDVYDYEVEGLYGKIEAAGSE